MTLHNKSFRALLSKIVLYRCYLKAGKSHETKESARMIIVCCNGGASIYGEWSLSETDNEFITTKNQLVRSRVFRRHCRYAISMPSPMRILLWRTETNDEGEADLIWSPHRSFGVGSVHVDRQVSLWWRDVWVCSLVCRNCMISNKSCYDNMRWRACSDGHGNSSETKSSKIPTYRHVRGVSVIFIRTFMSLAIIACFTEI